MTMMMRECRVKLHTFYDVVLFGKKKSGDPFYKNGFSFDSIRFFEIQDISLFVVTAYYFYKMKKKKVLCVLIDFWFYLFFWYQFLMMMMMREYV